MKGTKRNRSIALEVKVKTEKRIDRLALIAWQDTLRSDAGSRLKRLNDVLNH
ncbi:hypothetical protein OH492_19895 [Vibrio chagasii]|nr:hypothetical protein [Vibrio chagasii]